jgi:ribose-phosphate pyrophosphokinase
MFDKTVLFFAPQMETVAKDMLRQNGANFMELGEIDWTHFADGTPNFTILNSDSLKNRHVAFLACFDTMGSAMEQLMTIGSLIRRNPLASIKIFLPYYPTGTKDRWERHGEVVTALELARLMLYLPKPDGGRIELVTYDIHALQEESFFEDSHGKIRVTLESAMPLLVEQLGSFKNVAIAFPDEGATKRFKPYFSDFPQISCEKRRDGDKRSVWIREGDPKGRHVFIVDDIVNSGGTVIQASEALRKNGAEEVSLFAPHGVFAEESWKRVAKEGKFSEIWITDSCPATVSAVSGKKPFKVLSLAPAMANLIIQDFNRSR